MLYWHRLVIRGKRNLCIYCGVLIEACPCVQYRDPVSDCQYCMGSGWVAVVRGKIAKFQRISPSSASGHHMDIKA